MPLDHLIDLGYIPVFLDQKLGDDLTKIESIKEFG